MKKALLFVFNITFASLLSAQLTATYSITDVSCNGGADGSITANASGGTSPYTFNWSSGGTTSTLTSLTAGTYNVTVSDALGASVTGAPVVNEPAILTSTVRDTACGSYTWAQNGMTYNLSGTYRDTVQNLIGCDSIISLELVVNFSNGSADTATACDSYTWAANGTTYTTSGNYSAILTNAAGCDSIIALNLTINSSSDSTMVMQACNSFTWAQNGMTYTMSGMYMDTVMNTSGCDSVITLDLTVDTTTTSSFTRLSCDTIYVWLGDTLSTAGMYVDTLMNAAGCDSIVTLDLSFGAPSSSIDTLTACDAYVWLGNSLDSSGTYMDTIANASGCDSMMTLVLTINRSSMRMDTVVSCGAFIWMRDTLVDTLTSSGIYRDTLVNMAGCDSILSLDLTINQMTMATVRDTACDSYVWSLNNRTYDTTGTYNYVITGGNAVGCDSVVTLELVINASESSTQSVTSCFSYTWAQTGITYTQSGLYADSLTNAANCDSVLLLDLTINAVDVTLTKRQSDLTANQGGATYQWIDCDADTAITTETEQTFRVFRNGNYKVAITLNGCTDTSLCIPVTGVGLGEQELPEAAFMVMPNPTQGQLTVRLQGVRPDGDRVMIYNMTGEIVHEEILLNNGQQLELNKLSNGLYVVRYKNILKKLIINK